MNVNSPHGPAPPAAHSPQAGIGACRSKREQEREQKDEERLAPRPVDVVLVAGDEAKEVCHPRQSTPRTKRPPKCKSTNAPWACGDSRASCSRPGLTTYRLEPVQRSVRESTTSP